MPNTPEKSFIPRQTSSGRRRGPVQRVYLFTVFSYILLFATLVASGVVFVYDRIIDNQLEQEVASLNEAIGVFNIEQMEKVDSFDVRLRQAQSRIDAGVAVSSIFNALEAATVQTVQIEQLNLERQADVGFTLTTNLITDGFDSSIFQRGIFERNDVIETVTIEDITLGQGGDGEAGVSSQVSLVAQLEVPLTSIPFIPPDTAVVGIPVSTASPEPVQEETTVVATTTDAASEEVLPANESTP